MEQSDYLLEIGTEELPASFLETAERELEEKIREALRKNRLEHGPIEVMYTPRRLALKIHKLSLRQKASEETVKGPPVSVSLDANGQPTQAALGFARKMGGAFEDLQRESMDGTDYFIYRSVSAGQPVEEILPEILPEAVLSLSGSHFMAWDKSDIKFSRPIRWILSLLGDRHVPVRIGLVQSQPFTRGHRFFSEAFEIPIDSTDSYQSQLCSQGHVVVNQSERRDTILEGLKQKAQALNGVVPPNDELVNTVVRLVETPSLVVGSFSPDFLALPKEVITTVMIAHQKYFPVETPKQELLPYFITISNNPQEAANSTIRAGNEKVLRARLEDASFFFQTDRKYSLAHYVESLKGITFQKGLGTLYDKTERLQSLVALMGKSMELKQADIEDAVQAARLSKADLATNLVRELTELQGVMGRYYAGLSGEKPTVALAIEEHYLPRFTGDKVASSAPGILLSLADKLDTIIAIFSRKDARHPTGSKDPMGLRRMAFGIIQTILENRLVLNLEDSMTQAYKNLGSLVVENKNNEAVTLDQARQFLLQRFKGYLLDHAYSYDTIDAILECDVSPFANLLDTVERLKQLKNLQQDLNRFKKVYEPANRTARILGKGYIPAAEASQIDPQLFEEPSERALFDAISGYVPGSAAPADALVIFEQWAPSVEAFFDRVLVNAKNPQVKENRYRLLSFLNRAYRQFADFTKLVV